MSVSSFLKSLLPFVKTGVADVDKEIAAIRAKAEADINAAKVNDVKKKSAAIVSTNVAALDSAYHLARAALLQQTLPPASPVTVTVTPGSTGTTGTSPPVPTGASGS